MTVCFGFVCQCANRGAESARVTQKTSRKEPICEWDLESFRGRPESQNHRRILSDSLQG
jgi:hypothetical protein